MVKLRDLLHLIVRPDGFRIIKVCDDKPITGSYEVFTVWPMWHLEDIKKELLDMEVISIDTKNILEIRVTKGDK